MTIKQWLNIELQVLIEDIIRASEAAGQRASGQTYSKITREVIESPDEVTGSVFAPEYFYTLIRGRGPGKVPVNMAQIIAEWAQYKGIGFSTPEELLRFANAVAWKIRKEGSQLYRNHLYIDIIDTPVRVFEEKLGTFIETAFDVVITRAFNANNFAEHGFII